MQYSSTAPHTNCIVSEALVVHFSYAVTLKQMLDLGLLKDSKTLSIWKLVRPCLKHFGMLRTSFELLLRVFMLATTNQSK